MQKKNISLTIFIKTEGYVQNPTGKISEKAMWWSVFVYKALHFECRLKKTHSSRVTFNAFAGILKVVAYNK